MRTKMMRKTRKLSTVRTDDEDVSSHNSSDSDKRKKKKKEKNKSKKSKKGKNVKAETPKDHEAVFDKETGIQIS